MNFGEPYWHEKLERFPRGPEYVSRRKAKWLDGRPNPTGVSSGNSHQRRVRRRLSTMIVTKVDLVEKVITVTSYHDASQELRNLGRDSGALCGINDVFRGRRG